MMCCCEKCRFVFESVRLQEQCPDCGYGPIREATEHEMREYAANRQKYGPMPIYGAKDIYPVLDAGIVMIADSTGCSPAFRVNGSPAPVFRA